MSKKIWKYRGFIRLLLDQGFELDPNHSTPVYKRTTGGKTYIVPVHTHAGGRDIAPGTLSSMIRQSGLPKKLFR